MLRKSQKALAMAVAIAVSVALIGCSGSEERQARYVERAQQLFDKGDLAKARIEVKNALQINSNNAEARYLMAELEERDHNWQQMFGNLSAALETDPTMLKARIKLAQLLIASSQFDKAADEIDKILKQNPKAPDGFALRAIILSRQNKKDEAITQAQKALQLQPGHVDATAILATLYAESDPPRAEQLLTAALSNDPHNTMLQLLQIKVLNQQNKSDAVIAVFRNLIAQNPDNLRFASQLANFYIANNRKDDAEKELRQLVTQHPDNADAKLLLVEFLGKIRSLDAALQQLQQYSAAQPENYKLRAALARVYVMKRDTDTAIATYQYAIDKDRTSAEAIDARNHIIELLLAEKKQPQAEALIKDVLELEPENADALLTRARLAMARHDDNSAIADLRTVLKNSPDSPPALTLLAVAQERTGAPGLALDNYRKLLQANPDNVMALAAAARIQIDQNQLDDAQKQLEHAHQLEAGNIEVTRLLVNVYSRKQLWPQAMELCNALLINQKTAPIGYHLAGLVHARKHELPEAIDAFKKALEKEPRAIEPLQMLVNTLVANKQSDQAVSYLERHVQAHPEQGHAQILLGALYRQTGNLARAETTLKAVLAKQPDQVAAYRELATVYAAKGDTASIGALYQQGLKKNPDNTDLMLMLAEYYQATGNDQLALEHYSALQRRLPQSALVKNNLAVLLIDKFPTDENLRHAQSLTAEFANSDNPLLIDTLGWLQYKMKNYPQAVALLESAVRKKDDVPELHYHLGMAYLKSSDTANAKEELSKALAHPAPFPGRDQAEAELSRL
jgi:tetratricopeptide (TPR) repeat protein